MSKTIKRYYSKEAAARAARRTRREVMQSVLDKLCAGTKKPLKSTQEEYSKWLKKMAAAGGTPAEKKQQKKANEYKRWSEGKD